MRRTRSTRNGAARGTAHGAQEARLAATLFAIEGLGQADFAFRVLRVREPMPEDSFRARRLQRMADRLWRQELRCAVYPTTRFGFPGFLVPASAALPSRAIELPEVPDQLYHVEQTDRTHVIRARDASGQERELVCRMLERAFTDRLLGQRDRVWRGVFWSLFFRMIAENETVAADVVRAFRGLRFGVVLVDGRPHLAADARTKFIGRVALSDASPRDRQELLGDHLSTRLKPAERALFLRDNGTRKIPCRYVGETACSVADFVFDSDGRRQSVYDYYRERYPHVVLSPDEPAVFVEDRKGGQTLAAPSSRLFPVFTTEYDAIRRCSVSPQLSPEARLRVIEQFLPELRGATYGERSLSLATAPRTDLRTVFTPPTLEFGGGTLVRPFGDRPTPRASHERFDRGVLGFGSAKIRAVESLRLFHNEPLPDAVLLAPATFARADREQLATILTEAVRSLSGQQLRIVKHVEYAVGPSQHEGSALVREAERVLTTTGAGLAVVVLWGGHAPGVHGALKEAIAPKHSQCVTEAKAREVATGRGSNHLAGLVRNLALAVLTDVGVMPWVLADPLHHDVHVGIDLLYERIAYHALYGRGGRFSTSELGTALHHGRMHEHIKRPEMRRRIEGLVRAIASAREPVASLVIHRDGRWWPSERDGLHDAVDALMGEGYLPADFRCAVVEVRKNHMPVRLFTDRRPEGSAPIAIGRGGATHGRFSNPLPGSYLVLDTERVLLTTTGRPGSWDGRRGRTASTLLLELADVIGDVRVEHVAEDAYRLTHLNYNAPEIEIAHPVTIRWNDHVLRETLRVDERSARRRRPSDTEGEGS